MNYTKGEWKIIKSPEDWVIATDDELICRQVRHYNMHLIKASPLLYEALRAWDELRAMQPLDSGADIDAILQKCARVTDKALAKAEGK